MVENKIMVNPVVSIRPSDFVEGGAVPVDKNLTWKEVRFNLFDYKKKSGEVVATTVAARVSYVDEDGGEYEQQYSAADPARFTPSEDGKTLIPLGTATALSKSSNFFVLMTNLINAGFPENKLTGDVSVLDGLQTHNIGIPEPKRSGLKREAPAEGETARERVLSVPDLIIKLPWEKKGATGAKPVVAAKPAAKATAAPAAEEESSDDVNALALGLVAKSLEANEGTTTRQKVATLVFKDLKNDPNKDAVARLIFAPAFQATLLGNGYAIDGENITKAE